MGAGTRALVVWAFLVIECAVAVTYSSRLIHRFSDEVKAFRVSAKGGDWPDKRSLEYYRMLVSSDVERLKMKLGPQSPFLFPSEGSQTRQLGNDFGWCVVSNFLSDSD